MSEAVTCPDQDRLTRYVRGEIDATEKTEIEKHLRTCVGCARLFTRIQASFSVSLLNLAEDSKSISKTVAPDAGEALSNTGVPTPALPVEDGTAFAPGPQVVGKSSIPFLDPPVKQDEIGRLGDYRILKKLGAGGMGMVFLAEDLALERPVALKVMLPDVALIPDAATRFLREAKLAASIKSDHIVTIYQVGESKGIPYLAMEFLQGTPLDGWLKKNLVVNLRDLFRIGREIAVGLLAAHERGLVHRDIKPANIWMEAPRGRVKILDFGLARPMQGGETLTHSGAIVGTPAYMAPEQARGLPIDARTDLFSLGSVLYQTATGKRPFTGGDTMSVLTALAVDTPPAPHTVNPEIPQGLSNLIMKLLEKKPENRYPTARKVAEELVRLRKEIDSGSSMAMPSIKSAAPRSAIPTAPTPPPSLPPVPTVPPPKVEPIVSQKPWWSPPSNPWMGIDDDDPGIVPSTPKAGKTLPPTSVESIPQKSSKKPLWIALGSFFGIVLLVFLISIITVKTDKGILTIETDDPNVEVMVRKNGATIIDRSSKREIELEVGDYEIDLVEKQEGLKLSTKAFTITKDGKQTARVTFEKTKPKEPKKVPLGPSDDRAVFEKRREKATKIVIRLCDGQRETRYQNKPLPTPQAPFEASVPSSDEIVGADQYRPAADFWK